MVWKFPGLVYRQYFSRPKLAECLTTNEHEWTRIRNQAIRWRNEAEKLPHALRVSSSSISQPKGGWAFLPDTMLTRVLKGPVNSLGDLG